MNIATAHISGANLDLLARSLEKELTRPYVFSSGSLRVIAFPTRTNFYVFSSGLLQFIAFGMPPESSFDVITAIVMDFSVHEECDVKIYSGGGGRRSNLDCSDELSGIGLVLDLMKNISAANGWQYTEQRRVMAYPFDTEAY